MDYPRALDSSPEDRGLGVRDYLGLVSPTLRTITHVSEIQDGGKLSLR